MRRDIDWVSGAGRNVTLFDTLLKIAYGEVLDFKNAGKGLTEYNQRLHAVALQINQQFPAPLPYSEVRSTLRSVASWMWRKFSPSEFSARQTARGKRGANKRWAGHIAESTTKPWIKMGISERTFYRHKNLARLPTKPPPTCADKPWVKLGISRTTYYRKREGKL